MDGNNPNYRIITICHDLQERRVIDRIININKSVPAGYLVCSSYRIYWQQSCSDLYSSQEYCKYPVLCPLCCHNCFTSDTFCKSDISILISMRHWQQSCSAMDIFTLFLIPQMHIYSHGLQLRSPAGSCNRHNKNLFGSAIRQLLLLSKYPQIYLKRYPRHTRKNVFQSGIFYTTSE